MRQKCKVLHEPPSWRHFFFGPDARLLKETRMPRTNSQALQSQNTPDVLVHNEGTVFLFNPLTARAKRWMEDNVHTDSHWFGTTLVVEHRYAWRSLKA